MLKYTLSEFLNPVHQMRRETHPAFDNPRNIHKLAGPERGHSPLFQSVGRVGIAGPPPFLNH
jgi:hypothetical protein